MPQCTSDEDGHDGQRKNETQKPIEYCSSFDFVHNRFRDDRRANLIRQATKTGLHLREAPHARPTGAPSVTPQSDYNIILSPAP
jgi:hypothetical protein